MNPIYIFYDNNSTRIPQTGGFQAVNSKYLHDILTVKGRGFWDAENREYVFNRKLDIKKLSSLIPDIPILYFSANSYKPQDIIGFFNRPWGNENKEKNILPSNSKEFNKTKNKVDTKSDEPVFFTEDWQRKLKVEMHARKYSQSTIDSYLYYNISLCRWIKKSPESVTIDDIKEYLAHREHNDNQSAATLNIALSAFKFFYNNVIKNEKIREQKRPRQDKRLPIVLSKSEIKRMIDTQKNLKHQLLLMMVYSSGLRVSEVVSLKKQDIDIDRKSMFIRKAKGRKDRYTITSEAVIRTYKEYLKKYEITDWLFPGQPASCHLHSRTAQHIFEKAIEKACVGKGASMHSLRHSFATHLLESGVDIVYIRDLLGHSSVRTTERYTHAARRKALRIQSPMDTIDEPDAPDLV